MYAKPTPYSSFAQAFSATKRYANALNMLLSQQTAANSFAEALSTSVCARQSNSPHSLVSTQTKHAHVKIRHITSHHNETRTHTHTQKVAVASTHCWNVMCTRKGESSLP